MRVGAAYTQTGVLTKGRAKGFAVRSWSLELGAKKFHEQRTTGPLLFESAPAPPSAGFNVTFEDLTLDTAAGAPLIFARLTAVTTKLLKGPPPLSRRVTWGRVTLTSILARRRVGRGSGGGQGGQLTDHKG